MARAIDKQKDMLSGSAKTAQQLMESLPDDVRAAVGIMRRARRVRRMYVMGHPPVKYERKS